MVKRAKKEEWRITCRPGRRITQAVRKYCEGEDQTAAQTVRRALLQFIPQKYFNGARKLVKAKRSRREQPAK